MLVSGQKDISNHLGEVSCCFKSVFIIQGDS